MNKTTKEKTGNNPLETAKQHKQLYDDIKLNNESKQIEKDFAKLKQNNGNIDGCFNLPKTTIDSNRGGQAVDNRAEINSRRSSISKKSRSNCCRVC